MPQRTATPPCSADGGRRGPRSRRGSSPGAPYPTRTGPLAEAGRRRASTRHRLRPPASPARSASGGAAARDATADREAQGRDDGVSGGVDDDNDLDASRLRCVRRARRTLPSGGGGRRAPAGRDMTKHGRHPSGAPCSSRAFRPPSSLRDRRGLRGAPGGGMGRSRSEVRAVPVPRGVGARPAPRSDRCRRTEAEGVAPPCPGPRRAVPARRRPNAASAAPRFTVLRARPSASPPVARIARSGLGCLAAPTASGS